MSVRYIVESQGLVDWVVRDTEDPFGHAEPRFVGNEVECREVAKALVVAHKHRRRRSRFAEDVADDATRTGLLELLDSVTGGSSKDPLDVARELIRTLQLGGVCERCDQVYLGFRPERCEVCEGDLTA